MTGTARTGMKPLVACIVCLLLVCLTFPDAESRIYERSMEIRNPDIDPSWYTGRGIRPVGRFGKRGAILENFRKADFRARRVCIPVEESSEAAPEE
nr:PREDICTED: prolactin-releasing peptide [Latimeria chalumnae]|eukprot:XP_005997462.1 PREDICTED: prolactin-releasing peptide [Latimeria chalumnae]